MPTKSREMYEMHRNHREMPLRARTRGKMQKTRDEIYAVEFCAARIEFL